jgi:predicted metal-binding membrane protein
VTAIALAPIRRKPWVATALLGAAGIAWWSTAVRMEGMDGGPGTHVRGAGRWTLFACGYLLAWTTAGITAYGVFELAKHLLGSDLAWHSGGRPAAVGVLLLSAAYQLTPVKAACLSRCRKPPTPAGRGIPGAVATGLRAGAWCIGCTWALMAALFALGVMSITWMVLIALLVGLEKVGPWQGVGRAVTATVLVALAVGIAVAPGDVPGLVVPGSSGAMHAMKAMN